MLSWIIQNSKLKSLQQPRPVPRPGDVLVQVDYCGICGTEYQKYLNFQEETAWGHEIIGRIADSQGCFTQPVVVRTSFPCHTCAQCEQQNYHRCTKWKRFHFNGFSEYISVDSRCVIPLKSDMFGPEYALVEPLYVAIHLVNKIQPDPNDRIAIIGNGTVGLLCAFYLRLIGCESIMIFARSLPDIRLAFAERCSAKTYCYDEMCQHIPRADKIINTAAYVTMPDVIRYAQPHTVITFNGISKDTQVTLDMITWHFKNLVIMPSFPHPQIDFSEALAIIQEHRSFLGSLITHYFTLQQLPMAFKAMNLPQKNHIKVLICTANPPPLQK